MNNYKTMIDNKLEKKNKIIAIASVVVVYILMVICFIFLGLTHQVPPPPEYGVEVDMSGGGGGGSSGSTVSKESTTAARTSQRIHTQRTESTSAVSSGQETQTKTEPTQTIDSRAMFQKRTQQGGGGDGSGQGAGYGEGVGPGSGTGTGGGSGGGTGRGEGDFWLDGRPVVKKAFPRSKTNLEGVVVVEFRADREGNVIFAKAGVKGTTIMDNDIWRECERAAKESKFKSKADAFTEEKGTIRYRLEIQ